MELCLILNLTNYKFFRPIFKLHFFFSAIRIEMIFFIIMAENQS